MRTLPFFFSALVFVIACDRPPSADELHEWSPADHDRVEENAKAKAGAIGSAGPKNAADDQTTLIEATWKSQCFSCHGMAGRGDGPQGPMNHTRDLTEAAWQAKVTDAELAATIRTGKNKMPKFDLPPQVVDGLVARIRAMRGR